MEVLSDLDIEFSPSHWSKRFNAKDVIEQHVKFATEESSRAKINIPCCLDIPYGKLQSQKYDLFGTDLKTEAPIFVFIHGGYWQQLSKDVSSYVVHSFYKNGFKSIIVGYTLCPLTTLEGIMEEIQMAFKSIVDYAITSKSLGIHLAGHSAGAHLVATLLKKSIPNLPQKELSSIKSLTLISGVYDLMQLKNTYVNDELNLNMDSALQLSPLFFNFIENAYDFEVNVVVGENESDEFKRQSNMFYYKLRHFIKNVNFRQFKGLDHFDIVEKLHCCDYELFKIIVGN